jgi:DNA ligase 1
MSGAIPFRFSVAGTLLGAMLTALAPLAASIEAPPLLLANSYDAASYDANIDLDDYWLSEKYDGVRGYWDGRQLLTRAGHTIHAPPWFTAEFPSTPLDGELWMGRGQFQATTAVVRDLQPDHAAWRRIRFLVFDLPSHPGTFDERKLQLHELLLHAKVAWLQPIAHYRVLDRGDLESALRQITQAGGEGLMLHRGSSRYQAGRSDDLLKLKAASDAEATVIGYVPGKGKYAGMMGALLVQRADGLQFRLGSGFSDGDRRSPPLLGARVTYTYQGVTVRGVPRFARFLRLRDDEP